MGKVFRASFYQAAKNSSSLFLIVFSRARQTRPAFLCGSDQALPTDSFVSGGENTPRDHTGWTTHCLFQALSTYMASEVRFTLINDDDWIQDSLISSAAGSKARDLGRSPFLVSRYGKYYPPSWTHAQEDKSQHQARHMHRRTNPTPFLTTIWVLTSWR